MNRLITEKQVQDVLNVLKGRTIEEAFYVVNMLLNLPKHEDILPPKGE